VILFDLAYARCELRPTRARNGAVHVGRFARVRTHIVGLMIVLCIVQGCAGSVSNATTSSGSAASATPPDAVSGQSADGNPQAEPESSHKVAWTVLGISGGTAIIIGSIFLFAAVVGALLASKLSGGHGSSSSGGGPSNQPAPIALP